MLNNHSKEQFMKRQGSYSTHGSSRGYSDLGLPMGYTDFLPAVEKVKIITDRFNSLNCINPSNKNIRIQKTILQSMLAEIRRDIKQDNIASTALREKEMNFGCFFIEYCRENLQKDFYLSLIKEAREKFESN